MKQIRLIALILALLLAITFAACAKEEPQTEQTTESEKPAAESPAEPAEDSITLTDGPEEDTSESPAEPEEEEQEDTPEPEEDTQEDTPEPEEEGLLSDGEYLVKLERTQTVDRDGTVWASFVLLHYVEFPDSEISGLKPGDTVQLPEYSFVIVNMQADYGVGYREIRFNEGTERCFYIEETNTWRFTWPTDEPYLVDGEHCILPLAVDVVLTDELTPLSEGKNVYGVPNDGNDPTIGALDALEDFFNHYPWMEFEQASITVENGEITEVLIEYHP